MTPAEEDALIEQSIYDASSSASVNWRQAIRLAIRAAVAQERERAAKRAENYPRADQWIADEIAAAIRKGD